jgi:hypothetical protein
VRPARRKCGRNTAKTQQAHRFKRETKHHQSSTSQKDARKKLEPEKT